VSGAAVLALEILGTRLLSPYFGSNLYVWSALISVTLLALALGYWLGGRLADARASPALLDLVLAGAALLMAAIPPLISFSARALLRLPFEAGILLSAVVYFGPSLFLLGVVGPLAVRLAVPDFGHVGRSVGSVWACSAAGSIVGALATGFLLLPKWPVRRICCATAMLLLALAIVRRLARHGSRRSAASAGLAALGLGWIPLGMAPSFPLPAENGFRVIAERPSFSGTIRVVESERLRYLLIDGSVQTMQTKGGYPIFPYAWTLGLLPYLRPDGKDLLMIGLGGGETVKLFSRYGIRTTAVEVDPAVAETARVHFGLPEQGFRLVVDDGRRYLRRHEQVYDFVVLDAYAGSCPPAHLFSIEAFAEMKGRLRPGGLLAVNVVVQGHRDPLAADVAATLSGLFAHRLAFPTEKDPQRLGNVVLLASDAPLALPEQWIPPPASKVHAAFLDGLRQRRLDLESLGGRVILDERNAVEVRCASTDLLVRGTYRAHFPASVLH
jgi:spermidine synthase